MFKKILIHTLGNEKKILDYGRRKIPRINQFDKIEEFRYIWNGDKEGKNIERSNE